MKLKKIMKTISYIYWTEEMILASAKKYKSRSQWEQKNSRSYGAAHRRGLVDKACAHMKEIRKPKGYWNAQTVFADALTYTNRTDWNRNSIAAYRMAKFLRIFDRCVAHMKK
jgi:hypothetical protein